MLDGNAQTHFGQVLPTSIYPIARKYLVMGPAMLVKILDIETTKYFTNISLSFLLSFYPKFIC